MERYTNNASTTLNGAINNSTTTVVVTSAAAFPSSGNFRIKIESEIMLVTAVSSNTLTVVRGQEGTSGASHADTLPVDHVLTATALTNLITDGILSGAFSSRPTAERAGRLYIPTDDIVYSRDNGSSWDNFCASCPVTKPPAVSSLTWVNQSTTTAVESNGSILMTPPTSSGDNYRMLVESVPGSTPYSLTIGISAIFPIGHQYQTAGMIIRDSSSSKFIIFGLVNDATNVNLSLDRFTNNTTFSTTVARNIFGASTGLVFLRYTDDGTNRTYEYSVNGIDWAVFKTEGNTSFLTANQYGFAVDVTASDLVKMRLFHYLKA